MESAQLPKSGGEARNLESGWSEPRSWKMPLANPGALRKLGNSETVFCSSRQPEGGRCGNSETRKLFFAQKNAGPLSAVCNGHRVLPTARCLRRSGSDGSCRPCARALIRARGSTLTLLLDTNSGAWYYNNLTTSESRWVDDGMPSSSSDVYMAATPPRDVAGKRHTASPGYAVPRQRSD